ncbi:MAG: phosphoglucosamine mutase [Proteobacteria bacterium]|nr:phosphoglucosamine mutase [Pseudomonadota bacterium]
MQKLFGTDGIRGVANKYPMTPEMAVVIGKAVALKFKNKDRHSFIIIGRDTRISGNMIEYALASGICSMDVDVLLTGIVPTPAVAFLASSLKANAGIVVSASHNPYYDNGIKIFNGSGYKLSDETETEIENLITNNDSLSKNIPIKNAGLVSLLKDAQKNYIEFLKNTMPLGFSLKGIKMVMDCSNGATYEIAPAIFSDFGADVIVLNVNPDGKNINDNCGSEHVDSLIKKVVEANADIGIAFDGDGDRLTAVDEKGNVLSGDKILAIVALFLKNNSMLSNNHVVSTVMSNLGLATLFKENNINHTMSQVGDRYVMHEMMKTGSILGGEDSGHIIFLNHQTTGDGTLTALKLLELMKDESKSLSELGKIMKVFPQVLINVNVSKKPDINIIPEIQNSIKNVEEILGEKGRVLIRYSGTQPICRVMVEGPSQEETDKLCRFLADKVKETIG